MMRKREIHASGVDVQRLAQVLDRHDGTFDVPAGPPFAYRFIPGRLAVLLSLPQYEVASVVFVVFIDVHPRAGPDAAEIVVRQLAVPRKAGDAEVHRTVAR